MEAETKNRIGKKGVCLCGTGETAKRSGGGMQKKCGKEGDCKNFNFSSVVGGGGQEKSALAGRCVRRFFWESQNKM